MLLSARPSSAQYQLVGPNKCTNCHDHEPQKDWWYKKEGPTGHYNSVGQLEDKKSKAFAGAEGVTDVYDLKSSCVKCHATVLRGDPGFGVSCETCHGPGSAYVEPHQEKGSYQKAVSLGMYDTRGNYRVWAKVCLDCHVLPPGRYAKLIAAGHPPGTGFDLSVKSFGQVRHWKPEYDKAALGAAGRAYLSGAPAPAPAKESAKEQPSAAVAAKETPKEPTKAPERAIPPQATKRPEPSAARPEATLRPVTPAIATPAIAPAAPQPTPSLVSPPPEPPPELQPRPRTPTTPRSPAAVAAAERGKAIADLTRALAEGRVVDKKTQTPSPTASPATVRGPVPNGPEGELMLLQEDVLDLCRDALRVIPKPSPTTTPGAR